MQIRRDVESELRWDPSIPQEDRRYRQRRRGDSDRRSQPFCGKWTAEDITKRVSGVRAIANDIQVEIPSIERPHRHRH